MPTPRTGSVEPHGDHYDARVRMPDGRRGPRICLAHGMTHAEAKEEVSRLQRVADEEHARAAPPAPPPLPVAAAGESCSRWFARWFVERDRRGLDTSGVDRGRFAKWIEPLIGSKAMSTVLRSDLEDVVEHLDNRVMDGDLSAKTAANAWSLVTSAFDDAYQGKVRALRCRRDNPAIGVRGPDAGLTKLKVYLFPVEFLQLVSCEDVPLGFRRAFCVAVYLYVRAGEHRALTKSSLDLDHGIAHVHDSVSREGVRKSTKGRAARRLPIEPHLLPLLRAMDRDGSGFGLDATDDRHLSRSLQRWLRVAGLTRDELLVDTKDMTRKRMTWHDARATGITWCAVRGDDPLRIQQRAGHRRFETTLEYIREAENLRDGFGEVFPALPLSSLRASG